MPYTDTLLQSPKARYCGNCKLCAQEYPMTPRSCHPLALLVALIIGTSACTAPFSGEPSNVGTERSELIGGTVTTGDPAVVALVRRQTPICTGTLVSPRVILTAAHCIDMLDAPGAVSIFFGSDASSTTSSVTVQKTHQHPMWTGNLENGHDIGLVLMNFAHSDPSVARALNTVDIKEHIGAMYRHVGFGIYDRESGENDGKKREGTTTISDVQEDIIISGDDKLSVCFGDSGGPAFLTVDGQELLAGVHSFTSGSDCLPPNGDTNVQRYVDDFILPWIQENDPSCQRDGVCGPIGCQDDPDCHPCGPDGTCTSECERPDPDCKNVELGGICRAHSQCIGELCVPYREDQEYRFCSQECDVKNDTCPSGMSCREVLPFGAVCYYDTAPLGVLGDSCSDHADCGSYDCLDSVCVVRCGVSVGVSCQGGFVCQPESTAEDALYYCKKDPDTGGCQLGRADSLATLVLLLFGWFAAAYGRRRQSLRSTLT